VRYLSVSLFVRLSVCHVVNLAASAVCAIGAALPNYFGLLLTLVVSCAIAVTWAIRSSSRQQHILHKHFDGVNQIIVLCIFC